MSVVTDSVSVDNVITIAEELTGIDLSQVLFGYDGKELNAPDEDVTQPTAEEIGRGARIVLMPITIGWLICKVLMTSIESDKSDNARKGIGRTKFAHKVYEAMEDGKPITLSASEKTLLTKRCHKLSFGDNVYFAFVSIIDPKMLDDEDGGED
jgi:hypothetical protein